jgi:4'-phosphopantetheinyl transferase
MPAPPVPDSPGAHDVSVWRVPLKLGESDAELRADLAAEELERLGRLGDSEIGRRWLVSRAALREILAAELGLAPAQVRLALGPRGRPEVDSAQHPESLDFNLSHSGELALVATARSGRVGIDVERLRRGRDPLRIANRYFSPPEAAAIAALPEGERASEFLRYWTAKEALAKGLGGGLTIPWAELELVKRPGGAMAPVRFARDWRLLEVGGLPPDYCGTLAVDDADARVVLRDWRPGTNGD